MQTTFEQLVPVAEAKRARTAKAKGGCLQGIVPRKNDYRKTLSEMGAHLNPSAVFTAFVKFAACACAMQTREAEYMDEVKRWKKEEVETFAKAFGELIVEMDDDPFVDKLGNYFLENHGVKGKQRGGEFYTPHHVAEFIGQINGGELPATGIITVGEPACGAGVLILGFAKSIPRNDVLRLRVRANDVNLDACNMCYVNTSLNGIPTTVTHGNALSGEEWGRWNNAPLLMISPAHPEMKPPTSAPEESGLEETPTANADARSREAGANLKDGAGDLFTRNTEVRGGGTVASGITRDAIPPFSAPTG